MHSKVKLVGSYLQVAPAPAPCELNLTTTADNKVRRAQLRLPRIGRLPMGTASKAKQARSLAASVCPTGTDLQMPSTKARDGYNRALLAALRPKGNTWISFCTLKAVCLPGHAP